MIPFINLKRQYSSLRTELLAASDDVYSSGIVLDGAYTARFENAIADRCNRKYAVAVNSGTQGLVFSHLAVGGTSTIIPATSFVATLNSALLSETNPIIVDVDDDGIMDIMRMGDLLPEIHPNEAFSINYVNLYGNVIDYDKLKVVSNFFGRDDISIIEDAAQSFGAKYKGIPSGKLGDISVLSFDPTKNLPNYGSGGMVLTDDPVIYNTLRDLRDNGKYQGFEFAGTNSKMSENDCAHMLIKLNNFDMWQQRRTDIANFYTEYLSEFVSPVLPKKDVEHAWHKYVIRTGDRNHLKNYLAKNGVETKIHYETNLNEYAVNNFNYTAVLKAELLSNEVLSLPIYPELTDSEVEHVATTIVNFYTDH